MAKPSDVRPENRKLPGVTPFTASLKVAVSVSNDVRTIDTTVGASASTASASVAAALRFPKTSDATAVTARWPLASDAAGRTTNWRPFPTTPRPTDEPSTKTSTVPPVGPRPLKTGRARLVAAEPACEGLTPACTIPSEGVAGAAVRISIGSAAVSRPVVPASPTGWASTV